MRDVTEELLNDFGVEEFGYDFMGYKKGKKDIYNFHHLIVPKRDCVNIGYVYRWDEGVRHDTGYVYENGVPLCGKTSHPYLHLIETLDRETFLAITCEMIDMKAKGYMDVDNLHRIDELLCEFEEEFKDYRNKRGNKVIKEEYLQREHF